MFFKMQMHTHQWELSIFYIFKLVTICSVCKNVFIICYLQQAKLFKPRDLFYAD